MINNLALVQARMSSKRLPGKVIKKVDGEPLIIFLLKRLLHSKKINQIVLVTSSDKSDDELSNIIIENGFTVSPLKDTFSPLFNPLVLLGLPLVVS